MNRNPMLLLSVFIFLAGLLFITQGLLAELVTRTYFESQGKSTYVVRRVFRMRNRESPTITDGATRVQNGVGAAAPRVGAQPPPGVSGPAFRGG
jgi:hypothetical protein